MGAESAVSSLPGLGVAEAVLELLSVGVTLVEPGSGRELYANGEARRLVVLLGLVVQRLSGLYLGMATISFDLILSVVVTNGGELTGGPTGLYGAIADLTTTQIIAIAAIAVVLLALSERGRIGRKIETVRDDPELALSMGIKVGRLRRNAFQQAAE